MNIASLFCLIHHIPSRLRNASVAVPRIIWFEAARSPITVSWSPPSLLVTSSSFTYQPGICTCTGTIPFPAPRPISERSESGLSHDQAPNERTIRISAATTQGLTFEEETYRSDLMILPINPIRCEKELPSYAMLDIGAEGKRF